MTIEASRRTRSRGKKLAEWLLIETLDWPTEKPTIVNFGGRPRKFQSLAAVVPGGVSRIRTIIETVANTEQPFSEDVRGRRVMAYPHIVSGRLHGIQYWSGKDSDPVPPRPAAAAWWIDLTDLTCFGSDEWAQWADIPEDNRGAPRSLAALFAQVDSGGLDISAMRAIVTMQPGNTQQGTWRVFRRDKTSFACHFSCRIYSQAGHTGESGHRVARGVCHMNAPDRESRREALLVDQVLETAAAPGQYRVLVSRQSLRPIRWVHGSAIPDHIAWRRAQGEPEPGVHPEDRPIVDAMLKGLEKSSTRGHYRVRGVHGGWVGIDATADLLVLGPDADAALITFTASPENG